MLSQELNTNMDNEKVNQPINCFAYNSIQTNSMQWIPIRYSSPQIPVPNIMRPTFCSAFNSSFAQMHKLSYNYNSNGMMSAPRLSMKRSNLMSSIPRFPPIPHMITENINDSVAKHYFCRFCNSFSATNVDDLKAHLNFHLPNKRPFICYICRKQFNFRCLLRNHIVVHMLVKRSLIPNTVLNRKERLSNELDTKDVTNDDKQYLEDELKCQECGYCCKLRAELEHHIKLNCNTHPLKCPDCQYQTYTKTKLQRHEMTHIRDRPFACVKCQSTFSQTGSLKGHLIKVHKMVEFMFGCPHCLSFETKNFGPLNTHIEKCHENASFGYTLVNK